MYRAWELVEYARPHSPRVAAHIIDKNKKADHGNKAKEATADPVLMALNTDAPPGGLLATLKSVPKATNRERRLTMI